VRAERVFERACASGVDHGAERVLPELLAWLCLAQDRSASADGGVARHYCLIDGWATSYPETTGYIVPTLLAYARRTGQRDFFVRARRMLDWLVGIQLPGGGFMGGRIDAKPVVPVTFNSGQILLGLAAGEREFGTYRTALRKCADWLVQTQDRDGCWRKFPSPFVGPGEKAYETHVAWGLVEAARVEGDRGYGEAATSNARWALASVTENGWIDNCCLDNAIQPLTHTIGYALRGLLEVYRYSRDPALLAAAMRISDGLMSVLREDGYLAGQFRRDWSPSVGWVCLTGTAQIAQCWLMLFEETGDARYADAAFRANAFVRRTVRIGGHPDVRGGVKGSLPFYGGYGRYQYLNWAAKFLADSLMLEIDVRDRLAAVAAPRASARAASIG
jgi:hypothetical protein